MDDRAKDLSVEVLGTIAEQERENILQWYFYQL